MTKREFIDLYFVKGEFKTKIDADKKLTAFLDVMEEVLLKGEEINFIGFGKFEVVEKAARIYKNLQTDNEMKIEAKDTVKFKPSKVFSEKLNNLKK